MNVFSECVLAIDKIRGEHGTSMGEARVGKDCFLGNDSIFGRKKETIIVGSHVTGGWFTRNKQARNLRRCALKAGKTSTRKTKNLAHLTYLHAESGMRSKSKLGHL